MPYAACRMPDLQDGAAVEDQDTLSIAPLSVGTGAEAEGECLHDGSSDGGPQASTAAMEQEVENALKTFPNPNDIMGTACDAMLAKLLLWDHTENQDRIAERALTWPCTWAICSGCSGTGSLLASVYCDFDFWFVAGLSSPSELSWRS